MQPRVLIGSIVAALALLLGGALVSQSEESQAVYLVYYWRAKPAKFNEYSDYIRRVAEPIDEEARRAGVFEEVHTYTQVIQTGAAGADWTHMRVFKLKNFASWDQFSAGLDAATARLGSAVEEARRPFPPAVEMRDLVRQEIWREFR